MPRETHFRTISMLISSRFEESTLITKILDKVRRGSFETGHTDLSIGKVLGKGAFGVVNKGNVAR